MNTAQHIITLYIHPERGPIMPMQLDMMEVEMATLKSASDVNRDDVRVREIAVRIKKEFKDVEPFGRTVEILSLVRTLRHVQMFNGVVLRLPGVIDGKVSPPPSNPAADELEHLTQEILKLKVQREDMQRKYEAAAVYLARLESENKHLLNVYDIAQSDCKDLQEQVETSTWRAKTAQAELKLAKEHREYLEREKAALQTQLELAKQDKQAFHAAQGDLSSLRQSLTSATKAEQQLRDTLEKREQEMKELRESIRRLAENLPYELRSDSPDPWGDL
jgi:DNA repair exonuclease SbcCD ATPase subunit